MIHDLLHLHQAQPNHSDWQFYSLQEMLRIQEKEMKKRLPAGTLVIGTCQFRGEKYEVYELELHYCL